MSSPLLVSLSSSCPHYELTSAGSRTSSLGEAGPAPRRGAAAAPGLAGASAYSSSSASTTTASSSTASPSSPAHLVIVVTIVGVVVATPVVVVVVSVVIIVVFVAVIVWRVGVASTAPPAPASGGRRHVWGPVVIVIVIPRREAHNGLRSTRLRDSTGHSARCTLSLHLCFGRLSECFALFPLLVGGLGEDDLYVFPLQVLSIEVSQSLSEHDRGRELEKVLTGCSTL